MMSLKCSLIRDKILLAALQRGGTFTRKGSAKMEYVLKARINYANQLLGEL